jgi:hypothetical protein
MVGLLGQPSARLRKPCGFALPPFNGTRSREKQESAIGEQGSNTAATFDFLFESFAKDRLTGYPSAARAITHS